MKHHRLPTIAAVFLLLTTIAPTLPAQTTLSPRAILRREFIFDTLPAPSVHASTIVDLPNGDLLTAWFGGSHEGANDVGIWAARFHGASWSKPTEIARCMNADQSATPCYNPVLFTDAVGIVHLFYKAGPSPARWWGMTQTSHDAGHTWSAAIQLPPGILGPIKNKPLLLSDGSIISPSSTESTDDPSTWRIHFERSFDGGQTWTTVVPAGKQIGAIQPSILVYGNGRLQAIGRTRAGRIFETWSTDNGAHWLPLRSSIQLHAGGHCSSGRPSALNQSAQRIGGCLTRAPTHLARRILS